MHSTAAPPTNAMTAEVRTFLDSNVLIYAASDDARAAIAQDAVRDGGVTSVQVLNEFANVAMRKQNRKPPEVRFASEQFRALLEVLPLTLELHDAALHVHQRYGYSFPDALLIATALHGGCTRLLTENLHHDQVIDGQLKIVNPFLPSP